MNTNAIRDAKLKGARAAAEVHAKLGLRNKIKEGLEQVDVFYSIHELDIAMLCKPLDGLLGAYFCSPDKGIIVTTNRRLPIQRFTAAHELGHYWLEHEKSLDSEDSMKLARQGIAGIPIQEIEAEAFASEFLLPKLLMVKTAKKFGWNLDDLKNPEIVYQLSLRVGTSYDATRLALLENKIINLNDARKLKEIPPKTTKRNILKDENLDNPWADVYFVDLQDNGSVIQPSSEDTIIIELPEHSSGGYLWSKVTNDLGVEIINDESIQVAGNNIGSISKRRLSLRGEENTKIHIEESRPWEKNKEPLEIFDIDIRFEEKEEGLPRVART